MHPRCASEPPATGTAHRRSALNRSRLMWATAALGGVMVLPLVASDRWVTVGLYAGIYAFVAIGLAALVGTAGQVSVGQAGFFAVGGYTAAILVTRYGWGQAISAVAAVVVTAAIAAIVGLPLLRLRGHYLTLATLAFAVIVAVLANEWSVTGGNSGIYGVPRPVIGRHGLFLPSDYYWLVWPLVFLAALVVDNMLRGRAGRALRAARDAPVAAATAGVRAERLSWRLFVVAAGLGGVSGVLYVYWVGIVTPESAGVMLSVQFLLMAVLGGASVWGAVAGAVFVQLLDQTLVTLVPLALPEASGEYQLIGLGLVLAATMRWAPQGITGLLRRRPRPRPSTVGVAPPDAAGLVGSGADHVETGGPAGPAGPALRVHEVTKRFGGVTAVDRMSLEVYPGEVVGLIGPNGAGKTTLFNAVTGVVAPDHGTVTIAGRRMPGGRPHTLPAAGGGRTFQNLELFTSMGALENVMVGCHRLGRAGFAAAGMYLPGRREEAMLAARAGRALADIGFADDPDRPVADLAFGGQRLVEIARALAAGPRLLLLDEPMAGLSMTERRSLAALLRRLRAQRVAILLVEHDVQAVMSLCDRVVVMDRGRLLAAGTPAEVAADPEVVRAYLGDVAATGPVR
ncbi:branched-chain amino acid ABC transporter ATP-binding protein/permease [Dactylosporangium sp. AC04546]|uniref:branched-chain amino acid ABC transporter ATP-binding protein/permease n=1 Tax=Dactylosporangium sp. AC04546 TaxID=2862460 RepID=UPI001EDF34E1|nr:branched-chain amino acid ABC transporter ATP-binding protein/permease [Dactylosporangium sp. AC04546]WVK89008.1 branched-chain amino acid ABC transporter ATP-binding protein/permease [Dactylosporangium sp. AC04546]